jgi:cytosine/creatinine deaminase
VVADIRIPTGGDYRLARARVPACLAEGYEIVADRDGLALVDIAINGGRIESIVGAEATPKSDSIDLGGRVVFPAFVDCHTHIDKGHIWPRMPNPDGTFPSALDAVGRDRVARWNATDVERRMEFSLRCAYAHGTAALRTHLDSLSPQETISWPVFEKMRERWTGRIALQAASLITIEQVRDDAWFSSLVDRVATAKGVLGCVTFMVPDLDELLDRLLSAASFVGLDLDFHSDETADPLSVSLDRIAVVVLRRRFDGRVLVGHCCSIARQADDIARRTLDKVAEAGISIVSLPMCNMYLQDRRVDRTTPRWRGVTLLHEMKARGIKVAIASDNTRDPFYAYGDLDMLEVFREATRILHLDHPFSDWPAAVAATPAEIMGLRGSGKLKRAALANLVIFRGRSWTELLSRPESDRIVVRSGRAIERSLPDYSELDDLMVA